MRAVWCPIGRDGVAVPRRIVLRGPYLGRGLGPGRGRAAAARPGVPPGRVPDPDRGPGNTKPRVIRYDWKACLFTVRMS